jgi:ferredoxin
MERTVPEATPESREAFYEEVRRAVLERVCGYCVDRRPSGPPCMLDGRLCCVFGQFRPVVDSILEGPGADGMQPYLLRLRERVCVSCEHCGAEGRCPLREHMLCPLSYYFPLVVEAVESVRYREWSPGT